MDLVKRQQFPLKILYLVLVLVWSGYLIFDDTLQLSLYLKHFFVPLTMVLGSFVAGLTCEGGGAVAFPIFTKLLHIHPSVARDFSFAIQSIGMSFAALTIMLRKIPVEKNVIIYACLGGIVGIIIGSAKIAPLIPPNNVRLLFTLVITSFGIALFLKNYIFNTITYPKILAFGFHDAALIFSVGFLGGVFYSIIGTGIDVITFSWVTLLYRLDEKVATPSTVVIMAIDSIIGFGYRKLVFNQFLPEAFIYWILCIPVVAFFAPLGAIVCSKLNRGLVVKVLLFLIGAEFISTLVISKFNLSLMFLVLSIISVSVMGYLSLIYFSQRFVANRVDGVNQ